MSRVKPGAAARFRRLLLGVAAPVFLLAAGCGAASAAGPKTLPTEPLVVATDKGAVRLTVEVAANDADRERGLMFRKAMADDHGMIFDFPVVDAKFFWMKNTLIPLDMLFVGADGRIVSIARRATPLSETPIGSGLPAKAVIEINGGLADKLGIHPGDRVKDARVFPGG